MRTPEQIGNLRAAMCFLLGPAAFMLPDEQIDAMAQTIQRDIWIRDRTQYKWGIQVRTQDLIGESWDNILFEPKEPICSFESLLKKCFELVLTKPKVYSIMVSRWDNGNLLHDEFTKQWAHKEYFKLTGESYK